MIRNSVDFPAPFNPSTPIFAPGKNEREMSLRIWRLGGISLPTRFIVYTYCAMALRPECDERMRLSRARSSPVVPGYTNEKGGSQPPLTAALAAPPPHC